MKVEVEGVEVVQTRGEVGEVKGQRERVGQGAVKADGLAVWYECRDVLKSLLAIKMSDWEIS